MPYSYSNLQMTKGEAAQWVHDRLAAQFTVAQSPDIAALNAGSAASTEYAAGIYLFTDAAQATHPVALRVGFGTGTSYASSLRLRLALGRWAGGAFTTVTDTLVSGSSQAAGPGRLALACNPGGGLLMIQTSTEDVFRFGRTRTRAGAPGDGVLLSLGNAVCVYFPRAGYALSGSRGAFVSPGTLRRAGSTEPLLLAEPLQLGGGLLDPEWVPWEFLLAGTTDWAAQQQRALVLGGAFAFVAPLPGDSAYNQPTGARWIVPLEIPG